MSVGPIFVKFTVVNDTFTTHQQFKDEQCLLPISREKTVPDGSCNPSTVPGNAAYRIDVQAADSSHQPFSVRY